MKIIGFVGSSRKNGSTAWTVNKILEGARQAGAETQAWYSSETDIKPCIGCRKCVEKDRCVIDDDMQQIYNALKQADAVVLGSPIYMGQMSGQTKVFTDRLFAQITPHFSPHFKEENAGKKLVLVFTQGNPDASRFQPYYDYTKSMFQILEFDMRDMVIVTGTRSEHASAKEGLQEKLKNIGADLISNCPPPNKWC